MILGIENNNWAALEVTVRQKAELTKIAPPDVLETDRRYHASQAFAQAIMEGGLPVQLEPTVEQDGEHNVFRYRLPYMPTRDVAIQIAVEREAAVKMAQTEVLRWAIEKVMMEHGATESSIAKRALKRVARRMELTALELEGK